MLYTDITEEEYKRQEEAYFNDKSNFGGIRSIEDWNEGVELEIYDADVIRKLSTEGLYGHVCPDWVAPLADHIGKQCVLWNEDKVYKFVGFNITFFDYYYILEDSDGNKRFPSCVGGINFVNN